MSFTADVVRAAEQNSNYRRVLYTGENVQLVVMSIEPGEDIGAEVHPDVEQVITCVAGSGVALVDEEEIELEPGDVLVVSPGTRHDVTNDGDEPLKILTVYSPPNHIDGRVHRTRADAEADVEDREFGGD